jgi:hypothetical protein
MCIAHCVFGQFNYLPATLLRHHSAKISRNSAEILDFLCDGYVTVPFHRATEMPHGALQGGRRM